MAAAIDAMVAPAADRSIDSTRACLVSARAAALGDEDTDRLEGFALLAFFAGERVAAFFFDLGLVMGVL